MYQNPKWHSIDAWLDSLPASLPWRAVKSPSNATQLELELQDATIESNSLCAAMLWIRLGEIDRSHSIVQEDSSPLGSYLHGIVHRLEGDYWNSNYWMQRVRDPELVDYVSQSILDQLSLLGSLQPAITAGIIQSNQYRASALVDACERVSQLQNANNESELLEAVGLAEWTALWKRMVL